VRTAGFVEIIGRRLAKGTTLDRELGSEDERESMNE
jgi:hypothetical protein